MKAASFAALIEESVGQPVELVIGRPGQFDILVNGRSVISRKGGLLAKILGRPWPNEHDVVTAVRDALQK